MQEKFTVNDSDNGEALASALGFIREQLGAMNLKPKESSHAELMCEEALTLLMSHADFSGRPYFRVSVRKIFGDVIIDLRVPGHEFELFGAVQNINGVITRCSVGTPMKSFAPESVCMSVNDNILVPVRTMFLNGLKMCAVPVVFFSIVSCIADMGGIAGIKRTGGKLFKYFVMCQVLALLAAFGFMYMFTPGGSVNAEAVTNTLQASSSLNLIFTKITEFFMKIVTLVIFCSAASMIITTGTSTILSVIGIVWKLLAVHAIVFAALCLAVKFSAGLSPLTLLRKSLPMFTTAFSTCSNIAAIPDTMKCADSVGIPSSLYSFSIPVGTSLNKSVTSLYYSVMVLSAAHIYGINITPSAMLQLMASIVLLSLTTPALPGSGVISLSVLLVQAGCPVEFVGIGVSIEMMTDFAETMNGCFANMVCTLFAAERENLLDREKFNA